MRNTAALVLVFLIAQLAIMDANELVSQSNNGLASKLYKVLSQEKGNIFISPLSIDYALAALSIGASGPAFNELATALSLPNNENNIKSAFKEFTNILKNDKNTTIATKLFVNNQFHVKDGFKKDLVENFDASFGNVDFSQAEAAVSEINAWVEDKTNHKIKKMLEKGNVDGDTAAVLINAIYFTSEWVHPFPKKNTQKKKFYGLDQEYEMEMMSITERFQYKFDENLNSDIVLVPYKGDYNMMLIVPKEKKGIIEVERILSSDNSISLPNSLMEGMSDNYDVELTMPKFTLEKTTDLKEVLKKIGVKNIFKAGAFTKISDSDLVVTAILQKAYININETSTEAAAATGILVALTSASISTLKVVVKADHPFIFSIVHKSPYPGLFFHGKFVQP